MTRNNANPVGLVTGIHGTAAAIALGTIPCVAVAQTTDSGDDQAIEEIVVTGSRLLRRDFSAPSPIFSIDRESLAFSGQGTLESSLNKMPQVTPEFDRTANNPGDGTATVNLRGLGSGRTLVMLNGRRLASAGIGSAVDVNSLPQALIERVEIITGGASTVYGSDAVAGVVNFITRSDYEGFGLETSYYSTEAGDSDFVDVNVTYGHQFANGKGNITIFGGYYDREPTFMSEREISQFALLDTWEGELVEGGSSAVPEGAVLAPLVDFGGGPVRAIFDTNGDPREFIRPDDLWNYAPVNYLQVPLERYSAGLFFNYALNDQLELYTELTYTLNDNRQNLAPVPIFAGLVVNLDNPLLTPATQQLFADYLFPAGPNQVAGFFGRRMLEIGPRILDNSNENSRIAAGLRGDLNDNWEFDAWITYNDSQQDNELLNAVSFSRLQQGLLVDPATGQCFDTSNGCVPVNLFGAGNMSPEAAAFIKERPLDSPISREQKSVSAFIRGDLGATWAGPINTAFGVEWRSDEGSASTDDLIFEGDVVGYNASAPVIGEESVSEFYVEANFPLVQDAAWADYLALEVGGRYSEYDNAGSVDSYKAGLEWLPNQNLRFRAMYQRSVRAPNLFEAFQQQITSEFPFVSFNPNEDPCSASADPIGSGNLEKCVLQGIPESEVGTWEAQVGIPTTGIGGGNPLLTPEVAETVTVGFVFQPESLPNLQLSIDYFDLEVEDTIGDLVADVACFDAANTTGEFCDAFVRDPVTYDVVQLTETKINRGIQSTKGIDTQLRWSTDLPGSFALGGAAADLVVDLVWTHMLDNKNQETSFGTVFDCGGKFGFPCDEARGGITFPTNRITTNFNYTAGNFNAFLNWRWIEGTENGAILAAPFLGFPDPDFAIPDISTKNYFDLGIGYRYTENIVARFTIANLTDTSAPLMASAAEGPNTDASMYDVFGRAYTLSLSLRY